MDDEFQPYLKLFVLRREIIRSTPRNKVFQGMKQMLVL